ncbi:TPA: hypothetical protein RZB94_004517, partial [Salmonella enterica subsp. enterica serovar Liverpool]|nr:hypothetical protein [Salmonella enterica subsp. enterica serovar Liverpool]
ITTCLFFSLPALANHLPSSKFSFVPQKLVAKESSRLDFDNSPPNKKIEESQPEWREEPKYRQYSTVTKDRVTGEITKESYGIEF